MKSYLRLICLVCTVWSSSLWTSNIWAVNAWAETLTLSVGEYPPFDSPDLPHQGLIPRIVTEAFRLEGIDVEYTFMPWPRAYAESNEGRVNGTVQWLYSEQRAQEHYYSDPIMEESYVWFHLKRNSFDWQTFDDLKGLSVGARQGFTYSAEFYQAEDSGELDVSMVSSNQQNLDMLFNDRIDVFIEQLDVGYFGILQHYYGKGSQQFTHHPKPIFTKQNHLLLSRQHEESPYYLEKFNKGLKRLKASGELQQYINESRWLVPANTQLLPHK